MQSSSNSYFYYTGYSSFAIKVWRAVPFFIQNRCKEYLDDVDSDEFFFTQLKRSSQFYREVLVHSRSTDRIYHDLRPGERFFKRCVR